MRPPFNKWRPRRLIHVCKWIEVNNQFALLESTKVLYMCVSGLKSSEMDV